MYIPTYIPVGIAVFVYGLVCRDTLSPRGSRHQRISVPIYYVGIGMEVTWTYISTTKFTLDNKSRKMFYSMRHIIKAKARL